GGLAPQLVEAPGQPCAQTTDFVLEVDVGPRQRLRGETLDPCLQVVVPVLSPSHTKICMVRSQDQGRCVPVRVAHAEHRGVIAQRREYLVVHPRGVSKLDSDPLTGRNPTEKTLQSWHVLSQERRQLEQHDPELVPQRTRASEE